MIKLGIIQDLKIVKATDNGVYLAALNETPSSVQAPEDLPVERILLPKNQAPKEQKPGSVVRVFVYKDSEDRPIATTSIPPLTLGTLAVLPVKEVSKIGAFLNWGLAKDLLLPFKEQAYPVRPGDSVLVSLYVDKSKRLCATAKIYPLLQTDSSYRQNDHVTGFVYEIIDSFGAYVAVDNRYSAMIPKRESLTQVKPGATIQARVSKVLPDGKLELSLRETIPVQLDSDSEAVFARLLLAGGFLPFHDKSDAAEIMQEFSLSKNAFKRAIGHLMKQGKITISNSGIKIVNMDTSAAHYTRHPKADLQGKRN